MKIEIKLTKKDIDNLKQSGKECAVRYIDGYIWHLRLEKGVD